MAYNVDVVVVGGSTGAVSAAVAAAGQGASVFLAALRPYLGEDVCGPLLTWLEHGETPASPLAAELFGESPAKPLHVKHTLDSALETAGVKFLYGSYATELLRDGNDGNDGLAGIVMTNRTGRQAVLAKVIIDATDRAWVARMAGARFEAYAAGPQEFTRVVIGGAPRTGAGTESETLPFRIESRPVHKYTLTIDMPDGSYASFAAAEQVARDMTWDPGQADDSDTLFQVPPDRMSGKAKIEGAWPGAAGIDLDAFRPAGTDRLYVLGGCADVPRAAAASLLRPLELMDVGTRIGRAAAAEAAGIQDLTGVRLPGGETVPVPTGEVRETLAGVRPTDAGLPTAPAEARGLPVIGEYDVVVIGGGTGGAPAGIGSGRKGAKTLLVEYLHGLGGLTTLGLIGKYYFGYREGFTKELDQGIAAMGAAVKAVGNAEWLRRENRSAGTDIWFGALGCGAFVEAGRVKGAVVATPEGRGVVLAKVVIDSTGNADVAAAAGAACAYTGGEHVGVQGAGLPPVALGESYTNTDYTFADDTDVTDSWHLFFWAREKFAGAYDLGQLVGTRERRRIVGDLTISPMDIVNERTYPDTVVYSRSDFDSHGFSVHSFFLILPPDRAERYVDVPYRCLLPAGLDGIIVTGLGISAHRDAMPVIRMQPDVQNQGYAAGHAAAMAAEGDLGTRDIDLKALQQHLVEKGCLPSRVLTDEDSYPYSAAEIREAVNSLTISSGIIADDAGAAPGKGGMDPVRALSVLLTQPAVAIPLLQDKHNDPGASAEAKLTAAHVLGMLGDATGAQTLAGRVAGCAGWDDGWNYTGMGQYGASISQLDSYVIALGRTKNAPAALTPILDKVALLEATKEFSHHRAVAIALETLGRPAAAGPLADLLAKADMTGYHVTNMTEARAQYEAGATETASRNRSLRELVLARALFRCGDSAGAGGTAGAGGAGRAILENYARDLRGHYSRHARAVLAGE